MQKKLEFFIRRDTIYMNNFLSDSGQKRFNLRELEPIVTRNGGGTWSGGTLYTFINYHYMHT